MRKRKLKKEAEEIIGKAYFVKDLWESQTLDDEN